MTELNKDRSVRLKDKSAAAGGILRDNKGAWVWDFSMNLGNCSITKAELLGVREGLKLAWDRRIEKIVVEVDSEVIITLIKEAKTELHPFGALIEDCRFFLGIPWYAILQHTKRDGNVCADSLAKKGHDIEGPTVVWVDPPDFVLSVVIDEAVVL